MFPAIVISAREKIPNGSYARLLARFLDPDRKTLLDLESLLTQTQTALVAHYYMDPEIQGYLHALKHPWVFIGDSLQMGEKALSMAQEGAKAILVLGVDFMTENVRAILDFSGFSKIPVYSLRKESIGCTLAEAAKSKEYQLYLEKAAKKTKALHIIYINTSLSTKAMAWKNLPTLCCTSSNVVSLIQKASAQIPDLNIFFGPDTHMGRNLEQVLAAEQKRISFSYFKQGSCYVHELFGAKLVDRIKRDYPNSFYTAHFEVPGEMFNLALENPEKSVMGSTSQILKFILNQAEKQIDQKSRISFILGTEAGLAASLIPQIQNLLAQKNSPLEVEIVFPMDEDAMQLQDDAALPVLPGAMSGESCSIFGACASCKYMKMNDLNSMMDLLQKILNREDCSEFEKKPSGAFEWQDGIQPILAMRDFQAKNQLGESILKRWVAVSSI